jgi:hypothetical protein
MAEVVQMIVPGPDSQYRLVPCRCGGIGIYEQVASGAWRVRCSTCGRLTGEDKVRHEAQILWNRGGAI